MKVRVNRLYPYPVLSEMTNNFIDNKFDSDIILEYDSETAFITIKAELNDQVILSLIKNNKVSLICNIECPVTKFRQSYEVPADKIDGYKISIPLMCLNENIEAMCMLMAKEEIVLNDDNLNDLYKEDIITYPKNATIGYTDTDEYPIIKDINTEGKVPPIIQIVDSMDAEEVSFDANQNYIYVYLPKKVHELYYDLTGEFIRTKQIQTNITVLIEILDNIKHGEDYSDYGWYHVLDQRFRSLRYEDGLDDERLQNTESLILAQQSLGNPYEESFNELIENRERGM